MPRSNASKAVDAVFRRFAQASLPMGYSSRGRWLIRASEDLYHCISIQASQWNGPDEAKFAMNLLVVWPRWDEVWTGRPFLGAHNAAPIAEARLGMLAFGRDHWWSVLSSADVDATALQLSAAMEAHGDAFFSRLASSADALAALDRGGDFPVLLNREFIHATLLLAAGRRSECEKLVAARLTQTPAWEGGKLVAARLGVSAT